MEDTRSPVHKQEEQKEQREEPEEEVEYGNGEDILSRCASSTPPVREDTSRGRLLCWGSSEFGQTGRGKTNDINCRNGMLERFAATPPGGRVKLVACGSSHTVVVTCGDEIYSWGKGTSGQPANGKKDMAQEAVKVDLECPQGGSIKGVACGGGHTYIWLSSGKLYSFGNKFFAQLGYDFNLDTYKGSQVAPQLMRPLKHRFVVQVACGEKHSLFLLYGGQVVAVGDNSHGQIGSNCSDAKVAKAVDTLSHVTVIACGSYHSLAIRDNGVVYAWGYGQACGSDTGDLVEPKQCETRRQNFIEVAGGKRHSASLTANGNVYTWGRGTEGQLGHGENTRFLSHPRRVAWKALRGEVVHINCGDFYTAAVTATGHLYLWGKSSHVITTNPTDVFFEPTPVATGDIPVQDISCGAMHAAAITGHPKDWRKKDGFSDEEEEPEAQPVPTAGSDGGNRAVVRERTSVSLAEFYAPTPEIPRSSPEPTGTIVEVDEECKGERSRNHVRSTSVEECCSVMCDEKMRAWDMTQDGDTVEEMSQDCLKSSLSSLLRDDNNVVSSVNGQTIVGVDDNVLRLARRAKVKMHNGSDIGMGQVDDRQSSTKRQNSILLSPIEYDEPLSHDDVSTLHDRTRQLLMTSPVKLVTTANSSGVRSGVSCDPRPTNHTVQSSTSYASRFVLPREKSVVSNKQMDFVQIMSDFSQRTNELLQLQRNHTVIGLASGHSTDTLRSVVKVMWNRPRLRARPLGQLPPAGKKLKYHKLGAVGMDGRHPLLAGVTQAKGLCKGVPISPSPLPSALQYHPVYSSGMSWRQPGARPSTDALPDTVKTAYIERPPLHPKTIRTKARLPPGVTRSRLANRTDVGNTENTNNCQ